MPVQHSQKSVLRRMGRPGDAATYLALIARLRRRIPGLVLRTTLLTGFPGETEAEHAGLKVFLTQARFDRLGVFAYSPEAGTRAAGWPGQVPARVKQRRRQELMDLQAAISRENLQRWVGKTLECLVEEPSGSRHVIARTRGDAPEVDGGIVITGRARPGEFVKARVTGATDHDLIGELV
jgi:ribosomal protein S12 methylthiotransferase